MFSRLLPGALSAPQDPWQGSYDQAPISAGPSNGEYLFRDVTRKAKGASEIV
jgi:hypothetical protein